MKTNEELEPDDEAGRNFPMQETTTDELAVSELDQAAASLWVTPPLQHLSHL
jgi:hypothetical protein